MTTAVAPGLACWCCRPEMAVARGALAGHSQTIALDYGKTGALRGPGHHNQASGEVTAQGAQSRWISITG